MSIYMETEYPKEVGKAKKSTFEHLEENAGTGWWGKNENPYDFKTDLLQIHKKDVRNYSLNPQTDEFELCDGIQIVLPDGYNDVIVTAVKDFIDYLFVSMGISARFTRSYDHKLPAIRLFLSQELGEANGYMGYLITTDKKGISIAGYDDVGVAQALYFLEDLMNIRKAPYIKHGEMRRKALFDLRITQSPFGMFEYPDEALALIAHRGYNAIELWLKDECTTLRGDYIDVKLLCERAEKYGIKVYGELYALHDVYPDDPQADEFYDNLYGSLFKACPKLAGVTLVGEAAHFQSKDPLVGKAPGRANYVDGIPTGKLSPGWWPCCDYYKLVEKVKNAARKYQPKADIIVCSYNWGHAPEKYRRKLIESLPNDVSILATWEMFHRIRRTENTVLHTADYTLQFVGPGDYFVGEAKAAKEKGIRLYTIANTSGRTWDFGVIPYEPMSTQWIKRFEGMCKAHKEWNLTGVVENIHYGFHPSIIGDLEKWAFFTGTKPLKEVLDDLLKRDFEENAEKVGKAMEVFSEAITHYSTQDDDQYGAFRIGPSYPFWVRKPDHTDGKKAAHPHAMWGNKIYVGEYTSSTTNGRSSLPGVRIFDELKEIKIMRDLILDGVRILESCENPNEKLLKLLNLARFMYNTTVSGCHNKEFFMLKQRLALAETPENAEKLIDEIEKILIAERKNAEDTIPLVKMDSRLGWEPSMEYTTNEECLLWKIRQVDHELNITLPMYRSSNRLTEIYK